MPETSKEKIALRHCPWCPPDTPAAPVVMSRSIMDDDYYWVECPTCGVSQEGNDSGTQEDAAEVWNNRPGEEKDDD